MDHNTFQHDLAQSNSPAITEWWTTSHKTAFGHSYIYSHLERDLEKQKVGIDRIVSLTECRTITLEEKLDYTTYSNFALEVESTAGKTKGWIEKDIAATLFAYGFKQTNTTYYFPTPLLLHAWHTHKAEWLSRYGKRNVYQSNATVCPVPISVVCNAVQHHIITFS